MDHSLYDETSFFEPLLSEYTSTMPIYLSQLWTTEISTSKEKMISHFLVWDYMPQKLFKMQTTQMI